MAKAANLKRRRKQRGRPSAENVDREPNGRRTRSKLKEDIRVVAVQGRARVLGVPVELAAMAECGTVQGRLWLEQRISWPLKQAADELVQWRRGMENALQVPDSLATGSIGGASQEASEAYAKWATAAVGKWEVGKDWLEKLGTDHKRNDTWPTFERCILQGHYPTSVEVSVLIVGLSYVAARMGYLTKAAI